MWFRAGVIIAVVAFAGCGGSSSQSKRPTMVRSGQIGECADPERHGAVGESPKWDRHDRDLDGDGTAEVIVADRTLCTPEGNCYWNVFISDGTCPRYAGTIAGAALETLDVQGDRGFRNVRAWWRLSGGGRLLMEEYRYRRGGYRVVDSLLCRRMDDDRIECAPGFTEREP